MSKQISHALKHSEKEGIRCANVVKDQYKNGQNSTLNFRHWTLSVQSTSLSSTDGRHSASSVDRKEGKVLLNIAL